MTDDPRTTPTERQLVRAAFDRAVEAVQNLATVLGQPVLITVLDETDLDQPTPIWSPLAAYPPCPQCGQRHHR